MEVSEIEKYVELCSQDRAVLSWKAQTLVIVSAISDVWNNRGFAGKHAKDGMSFSDIEGTLEDKLAQLAKVLFGVANKLRMDFRSLDLQRVEVNKNLEDVLWSMDMIAMSKYRMEKKLIIIIGKLMSYCFHMGIDLLWFLGERLNSENNKTLNKYTMQV